MNNKRRKEIKNQILELNDILCRIDEFNDETIKEELDDIFSGLESIRDEIEWLRDEEQDAFDNIPENLQYSYSAGLMEENIEYLDCAINSIEEGLNSLDENVNIFDLNKLISSALNSLNMIN